MIFIMLFLVLYIVTKDSEFIDIAALAFIFLSIFWYLSLIKSAIDDYRKTLH